MLQNAYDISNPANPLSPLSPISPLNPANQANDGPAPQQAPCGQPLTIQYVDPITHQMLNQVTVVPPPCPVYPPASRDNGMLFGATLLLIVVVFLLVGLNTSSPYRR